MNCEYYNHGEEDSDSQLKNIVNEVAQKFEKNDEIVKRDLYD